MFAAMVPDRKVGPRLRVILANQMTEIPNPTHCGVSLAAVSPGWGAASTVASKPRVVAVTNSRKEVSSRAQPGSGVQ